MGIKKIALILRTVRHLTLKQAFYQGYYRFYKPRPDLVVGDKIKTPAKRWISGAGKISRLSGPSCFRCLNNEYNFPTASDWDCSEHLFLWRYNLHYFDYLNHSGSDEHRAWALGLVDRWIAEYKSGIGWDPYSASLRIVNWIRYCLQVEMLPDPVIHSIAVQADHLSRQIEFHLGANHLFTNGKTLVFAGLFFDGKQAAKWLRKGLRILHREIPEQFLEDGGHYERSPMYHGILLEDLLDLKNILQVYPHSATGRLNQLLDQKIPAGLEWLRKMTLEDGQFPLFGDSARGIAPARNDIEAYAFRLGYSKPAFSFGSCYLKDSGLARLEVKKDVVLFATVDGPKPSYQPVHAHADTLSFELYIRGRPVLVDCGVPTYAVSPERLASRKTAAHNTLEIDGQDSSEVWSSFRVGRRVRNTTGRMEGLSSGCRLLTSHDGYRWLKGRPLHWRVFDIQHNRIELVDQIESSGVHSGCIRFRAAPCCRWVRLSEQDWVLRGEQKDILTIKGSNTLSYRTVTGYYHPEFGITHEIEVLEASFDRDKSIEMNYKHQIELV